MGEGGWSRGQVFCVRCCSHKMGTVTRMFIRVIFDWHLYVYVCHPFQTVDYCGFMRTNVEDFVPQKPWLFFRWSMPLQSTNCRLLDHRISHTVPWSQNAVIKVCKVFQLQPAVIANSCASILAGSAKVQYHLYLFLSGSGRLSLIIPLDYLVLGRVWNLKLYATCSEAKQLSGKTSTMWNHSALPQPDKFS